MKRGRWADSPEKLTRLSQFGVVRAATLKTTGMASTTIYRRCAPGGPWQRLLPGIILMSSNPPTTRQKTIAALLFAGSDAVVTGLGACRQYGLGLPADNGLHVLVPHQHKLLSSEFLTVERTHRMPKPFMQSNTPLAPLPRAVIDAARRMHTETPAAKLLIEAIQRGGCEVAHLQSELKLGTPRGTALPRRLLGQIENLRSVAELHAHRLGRKLTTPPTHWNTKLYDKFGRYLARPDAWWEDVGLAWEIDSFEFHFTGEDYSRTLERNTRYAAAGLTFVQTLPSRLLKDTAAVVAELEAAYLAASLRPRPPVRLAA